MLREHVFCCSRSRSLFIYLSYPVSVCEMIFVLMILIVLEESEGWIVLFLVHEK